MRSLALAGSLVAGDDERHAARVGVRALDERPAAATASSKLESGGVPTSAEARASSTTASSSPPGSSSSLTISRP